MNKVKYKTYVAFLLLIISSNIILNVGINVKADEPKYGGICVVALGGSPIELSGLLSPSHLYDSFVYSWIYDSLVQLDENFEPQPDLAESWEISEDGKVYTFHLRSGVKWSDGEPLTSEDVAYSLDPDVRVNSAPYNKILKPILDSIETPDDSTVKITMIAPQPYLLIYLSDIYRGFGQIYPKHIYDDPSYAVFDENPEHMEPTVSGGPFIFEEWVRGDHITLVRNPTFWKVDLPYLDKVIFKIMPDYTARLAALETGEVDYVGLMGLSPGPDLQSLADSAGLHVSYEFDASFKQATIFFNHKNEYLQDIRVREALLYATDRAQMLEQTWYGAGEVSTGPIGNGHPYYTSDVKIYEYDPDKANQLLDEAGYAKGTDGVRFSLRYIFDSGPEERRKIGEIWRVQLSKVGVDLELIPADTATWVTSVTSNLDFDTVMFDASTGPDPLGSVGRHIDPDRIAKGGISSNFMQYNNSRIGVLFDEISLAANIDVRRALFVEIQVLAAEDRAYLPLFTKNQPVAFSNDFVGFPLGARAFNEPFESVYWTEGFGSSYEEVSLEINAAEEKILAKKSQFYGVTKALPMIDEARDLLEANDLAGASERAQDALQAVTPPYMIYAGVAVVVVAAAAFFLLKKR